MDEIPPLVLPIFSFLNLQKSKKEEESFSISNMQKGTSKKYVAKKHILQKLIPTKSNNTTHIIQGSRKH
jgi:uncharacterized membrane protein